MNPIAVRIILVVLLLGVIGTGAYFILGKEKTDIDDVEEIEPIGDIIDQPSNNIVSNPVNRQATTTQPSSNSSVLFGSGSRRRSGSSSSSSSSSSTSGTNTGETQNNLVPPALPESELNNFVPPALPQ